VPSVGMEGLRHRNSPLGRSWPRGDAMLSISGRFSDMLDVFRHVASLCFKCSNCFRCMFQLFHADVAYFVMVVHLCCKCLSSMFHLFFVHVYCKCFRRISRVFHLSSFGCCKYCICDVSKKDRDVAHIVMVFQL
jgi:hypothetical protein